MKRFVQGMCIALCLLIGGAPVSGLEGEPEAQAGIVGYSRSLIEPNEDAEQAPDITVLAGTPVDQLIDVASCYRIITPEGLVLFSELVNSGNKLLMGLDVYLGADIDMSGIAGFEPIGNGVDTLADRGTSGLRYNGTFDGRGYRIDGLELTAQGAEEGQMCYLSLFGVLDKEAVVKNLVLGESCRFVCTGEVENVCTAAVAGRMLEGAMISNVLSLAAVSGGAIAGGLVARLDNDRQNGGLRSTAIRNCTNMGSVDGSESAGGLIGLCRGNAQVSMCRNMGKISAAFAGGMVGKAEAAIHYGDSYVEWSTLKVTLQISGSENHGNLSSSGAAGGMVGHIENAGQDGNPGVDTELSGNLHTGGIRAGESGGALLPWVGSSVSDGAIHVSECTDGSSAVRLHGSQLREEADGTYAVRFVGSIGSLDYREIGYTVRIKWNDRVSEEQEMGCGTVYRSMQLGEEAACTAEELRGEESAYLCILTITDIPSDAGRVEFEVTPYGVRKDGRRESGERYRIVYDGGSYLPAWEEEAG